MSLVVVSLATVALDVVEVLAAGSRVSSGSANLSCVSAVGVASAAICPSPADAKTASKPHRGGGSMRWMSS